MRQTPPTRGVQSAPPEISVPADHRRSRRSADRRRIAARSRLRGEARKLGPFNADLNTHADFPIAGFNNPFFVGEPFSECDFLDVL